MDCKSMDTPMVTNLKKLRGFDSRLVDQSMYRRLISMSMYLVNTKPNICFALKTLSQFQVELRYEHWIAAKHILKYLCGTVNYGLRTQRSIALNTIEAESIAANKAFTEAVWPLKLFAGLFGQELEPTEIHYDNLSCVKLSKNLMFHDRSKHIEIKYHHISDMV
eukprot:PITA_14764